MPTVSRVVMPNGVGAPQQFVADDPLAGAMPVACLQFKWKKVLTYGPSGAGKTTLAALFPKPQLFISYEPGENGGMQSVRKVPGVSFVKVTGKQQALAIARRLAADARSCWHLQGAAWAMHLVVDGKDGLFQSLPAGAAKVRPVNDGLPYASHVHDSGTSLEDVVLKDLMGWRDVPVQLNWGTVPLDKYRERSEQAKEVLREFRELPADVVILAKEKDFDRDEGVGRKAIPGLTEAKRGFWSAAMGKQTVEWLQDGCDYVMRLYPAPEVREVPGQIMEIAGAQQQGPPTLELTGKVTRRLRCTLSDTFAARFRSPDPECVAEYVEGSPQELYDDFQRMVRGEKAVKGHYPGAK